VEIIKESRDIQPNRLIELPAGSIDEVTSSSRRDGLHWQEQQDMKREDAVDFIERKD